ncbi:MAG: glycosyltransferase family 4 protein [Rhodopirellula sp.]|nr:glycosyltransferase family 4 protein [Rhodopirellula sp.]
MRRHIRVLAGSLKPTAGSHIYNRELIRRLAARGNRVSVVSFDDGSESGGNADWRDQHWGDVELTCLPRRDWNAIPAAWRFASTLQGLQSRRDITSATLDEPDVVIGTEHLFLKAHARRFPRTPWLYLAHSLVIAHEIDSYGMTGLQHRLARNFYIKQQQWALRHSSTIVRFNQSATNALMEFYGAEALRAPVLINPTGIDSPETPSRERYHNPEDPLRLLFVGRLVASKNLKFVLHSLADLRATNWTLDVVGDGPELEDCRQLVKQLQLCSQVTLQGHQTNTSQWYENADLLLFPSKLENMPLVLLESMAHGTPALVIREDGDQYRVPFSEVIEDNVTGLIADNEEDFSKRLADVIASPVQLSDLSANAQAQVREHYTWDQHLDCFDRHIDKLLGQPSRPVVVHA